MAAVAAVSGCMLRKGRSAWHVGRTAVVDGQDLCPFAALAAGVRESGDSYKDAQSKQTAGDASFLPVAKHLECFTVHEAGKGVDPAIGDRQDLPICVCTADPTVPAIAVEKICQGCSAVPHGEAGAPRLQVIRYSGPRSLTESVKPLHCGDPVSAKRPVCIVQPIQEPVPLWPVR